MKAIALLGVALFLMASGVFGAGSENIIKQRAKDLRDQNNARQGVTQPTPQFTPAAPVPAASSSNASAQTADPALSKVQIILPR